MAHQRNQEQDQKQIKQNFGDACSGQGDSGESQQGGDQRDDKKSECPAEHYFPLCSGDELEEPKSGIGLRDGPVRAIRATILSQIIAHGGSRTPYVVNLSG